MQTQQNLENADTAKFQICQRGKFSNQKINCLISPAIIIIIAYAIKARRVNNSMQKPINLDWPCPAMCSKKYAHACTSSAIPDPIDPHPMTCNKKCDFEMAPQYAMQSMLFSSTVASYSCECLMSGSMPANTFASLRGPPPSIY